VAGGEHLVRAGHSRVLLKDAAAYNPATGTWTALPAAPLRGRESPVAVWTGRQMILWGGFRNGTPPRGFTDGAGYTPAR